MVGYGLVILHNIYDYLAIQMGQWNESFLIYVINVEIFEELQ